MVELKAGNNPVIDAATFAGTDSLEVFADLGVALENIDDGNILGGFLRRDDNKTQDVSDDKYVVNFDDKLLHANTTEGQAARASFRQFAVQAKEIYKSKMEPLGWDESTLNETLDAIEAQLPAYETDPAGPATKPQVAPAVAKPVAPLAPVVNAAPAALPTINFSANMGKNTMAEITTKLDTAHIVFQMDGDKLAFKMDLNKFINDEKYRGDFILIVDQVNTFISNKLQIKNGIIPKNLAQKPTPEQLQFIGMLGESYVLAESLNRMSGTANMGIKTSAEITTRIDANNEFFKLNGDKLSFNVDLKKLGADATYRQSFLAKSELALGFIKQKLETMKLKFDKLPAEQQKFLNTLYSANSGAKTLQAIAGKHGAVNQNVTTDGAAEVAAEPAAVNNSPLYLALALIVPAFPIATGAAIFASSFASDAE